MSQKKNIAIIGAGAGGLAAAALIAKEGHQVHVFEKNDRAGGRANILKKNGFTFDLGPSWYLEPNVFEIFLAEFGKKPEDFLELLALDPQYTIFFDDHTSVSIPRKASEAKRLFESLEKGSGKQFEKYLKESQIKFDISMENVLYKNADTIFDFFNWELLKRGRELHALESMDTYVKKFFKTEKMQQIIQYTLVFLGGSPKNVPALYSLMTHIDFNLGVFYPKGGFYKVIEMMVKICKKQGVIFHFNSPVEKMYIKNEKITEIQVKKEKMKFDAVISNADYAHTENLFSDTEYKMYDEKYWQKSTLAPSAFLLFLGVKGKIPELQHHNIYFGKNWLDHFETIFNQPEWPQTPSLYINKPSFSDPTVAPKGHENLMILVPVASRLKETEGWKKAYADFIISYVEESLNVKLKDKIVEKHIFSVSDFTSLYNSLGGNALGGLAHTLWQTGPFRPPNKHAKIKNMFFVGANTVPGIGVPSALISGHLVRDRVKAFFA